MKRLYISDDYIIRKGWRIDLGEDGDFEIDSRYIGWNGREAKVKGYILKNGKKRKAILHIFPASPSMIENGDDVLILSWRDYWRDYTIE